MINFKKGNNTFNYRIAGVTIFNNNVLLHRLEKDNFWALPGGRCELNETSKDTLQREYLEEMEENVKVCDPIWIVENFFGYEDQKYHEMSFIYKVEFNENSKCLKNEVFYGHDNGHKLIFKWFPLEKISQIELYPTFLKQKLNHLPNQIEHLVHYDS